MKTDFYTKTVLSIIAVCLTILCLKNFSIIKTAQAGRSETINVNIERVAGHYIQKGLPVEIVKGGISYDR